MAESTGAVRIFGGGASPRASALLRRLWRVLEQPPSLEPSGGSVGVPWGGGATCKAVPDVSTAQAGPEQAHATAACVVAHATEVGGEGARLEGGGVAARGELG